MDFKHTTIGHTEGHMFLQSCAKLIGTHGLLTISDFMIKMFLYKMT